MRHLVQTAALFVALTSLVLAHSSVILAADEIGDLKRRIEELELRERDDLVQSTERTGMVRSFLSDGLTFGGFFEHSFALVTGPNTKTQAVANQSLLGINLAADFNKKLRFVSQHIVGLAINLDNLHSNPNAALAGLSATREFRAATFGALVSQGYLEYALSPTFNLKTGIGYVPFGQAFQQREPVLFLRKGGPQMLHTQELASPLWLGFHIFGAFSPAKNHVGYDVYSTTTATNVKIPGLGSRVWWSTPEETLTFGVSAQSGKRYSVTYLSMGGDLKLKLSPVMITAEWINSFSPGADPWSFYIEPSLALIEDEWLVYLSIDYADSPLNQTIPGQTSLLDPYQQWEFGGGVNWLPTSFTRIRAGVTAHRYVGPSAPSAGISRDYVSVDLSGGIAF